MPGSLAITANTRANQNVNSAQRWVTMMNRKYLALALGAFLLAGCQSVGNPFDGFGKTDPRTAMAQEDVDKAVATMQIVLESYNNGHGLPWHNAETGNSGRITAVRTFQTDAGLFCRDFRDEMTVGGQEATYTETACRGTDGLWRLAET